MNDVATINSLSAMSLVRLGYRAARLGHHLRGSADFETEGLL